jgi:3-isopropylmalate/(R)-2-methylmalate dehydratase large subunit
MRITVDNRLQKGVSAKDLAIAIIAHIGVAGGSGHVIEYHGSAIHELTMDGRMTLCNLTIEGGARAGMVAPDEATIAYLKGRMFAPRGTWWDDAVRFWRTLPSDDGAAFDREERLDGSRIEPMVTWGTYQDEAVPVTGSVPDPQSFAEPARQNRAGTALAYMKLKPGVPIRDIKVDRVFIGSCTNGRIEDFKEATRVIQGRKVVVPTTVVPGSMTVKREAEALGLHEIFLAAGCEWRDPGCSMCTGSNGDVVPSGERCASTSNRNFEGRQGRGSLTHLVSPAMAAACAVTGRLADVRDFL